MAPRALVGGRYALETKVGSGATGTVFRARDRETGDLVAIKLLHDGGAEAAERFSREAEVLARLAHPGIVRLLGHGVSEGRAYLALEWLEGETLADRLARGVLGRDQTLALTRRVAAALGSAHRRRIVHRDFKPRNMIVVGGRLEQTKVLDFGVAHLATTHRLTAPGATLGTPRYMAPEQARGQWDIGPAADVFSLGCVMYECLTGRAPFAADDVLAVLLKVLLETPPPVAELRPNVPPALGDLIGRMMSKDPAQRPPDGDAVVAEVDAIGECSEPVLSRRPAPPVPLDEQRVGCVLVVWPPSRAAAELSRHHPPWVAPMREIVERNEGTLQPLADGSLLGTFRGHDASHQAVRAARSALEVRAHAPQSSIAIASGRSARSAPQRLGPALERVAEQLRRERESRIVVDQVTAALLGSRFLVEGVAHDPYLALIGEREDLAVRRLLGRPTQCIGRTAELATVRGVLTRVAEGPTSHAVLLTGEAGIGKSRILYEIVCELRARSDVAVWTSSGDLPRAPARYGTLGQLVRQMVGIEVGDTLEVRRRKLSACVASPEDAAWLGETCATPLSPDAAPPLPADPAEVGERILRGWANLVARRCDAGLVVLAIEDLAGADRGSVEHIGAALRQLRDRPFCVLATARPDVHEAFPELWADCRLDVVRLGPLGRRAGLAMVRDALGDAASREVVEDLVTRAGGNPLFLEELVREVHAGGQTLPDTILAVLQGQFDRLSDDARQLMRAASVFGMTFSPTAVATLLGPVSESRLAAALSELVEHELIEPASEGAPVSGRTYAFRHGLVREAAYETLRPEDRASAHRAAGEWLKTRSEREHARK